MASYMLDTNIFNRLLDGRMDTVNFEGRKLIATHVQLDELAATSSDDRRHALTKIFVEIVQEQVPTENMVWGASRWGQSKWSDGTSKYSQMLSRLEELDFKSKKRAGVPDINRARDILIAETAVLGGHTLLTADRNLHAICKEFGGSSELVE